MRAEKRSALVIAAICALFASSQASAAAPADKDASRSDNKKSGLSVAVEAGLGYDSNVFLTPDNQYVNPVTGRTVTTDKQAGFFIPLGIDAKYLRPLGNSARLLSDFSFDGHIYEPDVDNANLYDVKFSLGPEFSISKDSSLYAGMILGYHKEIYYDRDDGQNEVSSVSATDISDRYTYSNAGVELSYRHELGKVGYEVFGSIEKRDYEDPIVVSQYDHDYLKFGGSVDYDLAASTKVSAGYRYSIRDYNDRQARDLNGNLVANQQLEYTYHTIDLVLKQRVNKSLVVYVDYSRQERKDEFLGYNDYSQNRYKVWGTYKATDDLKVKMAVSYWDREYDRAFAFDDSLGGKKDYSGVTFDAGAEYGYSKSVAFWADLNYDSQDTTDKRYDYDRTQLSAGVKYEF